MVVLTLVPEGAADAVGQPRLGGAGQQAAIDGLPIHGLCIIALVRLDQGATDRAIDDADGQFLGFDQAIGKVHGPVAYFPNSAASAHRPAPSLTDIRGTVAIATDPLVGEMIIALTPVHGNGVGLTVDDVGVSAH